MDIFINNVSAMRFYSLLESSLDDETKACPFVKTRKSTARQKEIERIELASGICLSRLRGKAGKLHVLVDDDGKRWPSRGVVCHLVANTLPKGSFRRIADHIYVVSPELCFFEMGSVLALPKLIEFGFLLCGTYTVNPDAKDPNSRRPFATVASIQSFLERMPGKKGRRRALEALGFVLENSASPRETKTALLLFLPVRFGGYGFPPPVLNHRFDYTREEQAITGVPYAKLDLWWPDHNFGIEYDGGEGHSRPEDVSRDRRKSSNLQYLGINVIRVDKNQLSSPEEVYALAMKCAKIMGVRLRKPTPEQWRKKQELFDAIMR